MCCSVAHGINQFHVFPMEKMQLQADGLIESFTQHLFPRDDYVFLQNGATCIPLHRSFLVLVYEEMTNFHSGFLLSLFSALGFIVVYLQRAEMKDSYVDAQQ